MPRENRSWQATRQLVIARAGGMCEGCKERRGAHVHHLKYWPKGRGGEPLEWLLYLCLECHGIRHPRHTFRPVWEQKEIAEMRRENPKGKGWKRLKRNSKRRRKAVVENAVNRRVQETGLASAEKWDMRERLLNPGYWGRV